MTNYREKIKGYKPLIGAKNRGGREKTGNAWKFMTYLFLVGTLTITAFAAGTIKTNDWDIGLTVTGPSQAIVGQPLYGINVRVFNRGLEAPDSRLRLIFHAEGNRALATDDIKIDIKEGNAWRTVQVEAIDKNGLMGVIDESGIPYTERHKHGGFTIGKNTNRVLPMRVTFRLPGRYTLVVAASPDNGQTHIAQPASLSVEAL